MLNLQEAIQLNHYDEFKTEVHYDDFKEEIDCGNGWVAHRGYINGKKRFHNGCNWWAGWTITYNGEIIADILRTQANYTGHNWTCRILFGPDDKPCHRLITKDTRMVVEKELRSLIPKISKAYHKM